MTITISFNKHTFKISNLPHTLSALKNTILQQFRAILPSSNFELKATFINHSNKNQSIVISSEPQYQFLPRQMRGGFNNNIQLEIIPYFTSQERKDVVIIEDESTQNIQYIDCKEDENPVEDHNSEKESEEELPSKHSEVRDPSPKNIETKSPQSKKAKDLTNKLYSPPQATASNRANNGNYKKNRSQEHVAPNTQARASVPNWRQAAEPIYRCNNCGENTGRVRYASTKAQNYDLCEDCVREVDHPYAFIEYIDNKPVRQVFGPSYNKSHATFNPFGSRYSTQRYSTPRYSTPRYSTPRYTNASHFPSMFDSGFSGFSPSSSFFGFN